MANPACDSHHCFPGGSRRSELGLGYGACLYAASTKQAAEAPASAQGSADPQDDESFIATTEAIVTRQIAHAVSARTVSESDTSLGSTAVSFAWASRLALAATSKLPARHHPNPA